MRRRRSSTLGTDDVAPLVEQLLKSYSHYWVSLRPGVMELNWRLATTETTRSAFFSQLLWSLGLPRVSAQYSVLRDLYFAEDNRLSQSQIMKTRRVSSANVTRLIHRMERSGLVRREAHPADKRSTMVSLTDVGYGFCERVVPVIAHEQGNITKCFSAAEIDRLNTFLARLHRHVEELSEAMTPNPVTDTDTKPAKRQARTTRGGTPGVY